VKAVYRQQVVTKTRIFLGYNNRFRRRLDKSHPNIWMFIDSLRKEVNTIHDLIIQINSGMGPRTKRSKVRLAEQRTKELYDRFNNNQIHVEELLRGLSLFVANAKLKKIEFVIVYKTT